MNQLSQVLGLQACTAVSGFPDLYPDFSLFFLLHSRVPGVICSGSWSNGHKENSQIRNLQGSFVLLLRESHLFI
jgi:hypothetical protein